MSISSYVVPETVTFIETRAFLGAKITSIAIPSTITNLPTQALRQCSNLESVTFGENSQLTVLGNYNFEGSKSLPSIKIPDGVQILQNYTFGNCSILEYVIFSPDSQLKTVMRDCFYRCTSLKELTLPVGVTSIGANAFGDSTSFASLILKNATPCSIASDALKNTLIATADGKIYVPNASVEAYKGADVWSNYSTQIYRNPLEFVTFENTRDAKFFGGMTFTHDVPNHQITLSDLEGINCTFLGWMGPGYDVPTKSIVIPDNIDEADARTYTACRDIHNVTYELEGGTNHVNNKPIYSESNLPQTLYNPTKEGYTFAGWYDNLDFNGDVIIEIPVGSISDKTYYAKWTANINTPYAIEYYKQNLENYEYTLVETDDTRTGTTGQTVSIVNYENKYTGFTCSEINSVISGVVAADGSLVLKAYYERNQYTITFNSNGGSQVVSIEQGYETTVERPEDPIRSGYTFVNWYTDNGEFINLFEFDTLQLNAAILYAKWNPDTDTKYTIEYYQQNIESDQYTLVETDDTRTGTTGETANISDYENKYTGFTYEETKTVISGTISGDGSLTLTVYYSRNQYTITFNSNGGSQVAPIEKDYEAEVAKPENPTLQGYTFDDWYTDNGEFLHKYTFTTMPLNGATLYAKWTVNTNTPYTVEYYQQNIANDEYTLAETDDTKAGTTGETASIIGYVDKYTGFTFTETNSLTSGTITADGSLVLKAYYNRNKYIVTFVDFDNTQIGELQEVKHGGNAVAPQEPSREGYEFLSWDTSFVNVTQVLKVKATYIANQYTITFNTNCDAVVSSITKGYETAIEKPENPKRTGYTFVNWYTDNDEFTKLFVFNTMPLNGATLYAKWDANTDTPYAIEYYQEKIASDEYELYDTDNTLFGTTDSEITLTGYENKYTGFTYSETNSMISGTIAADGSLTLKVYYNRNICTATFTNGNTAYDVQVLKYGGSILIPTTNPTKEANAKYTYKFNGWDPSVPETISTTIEFVAQYIEVINKYTVTFKDFDGRVLKTQMVEYSSSATAPVNPTRENYAFIGWDVNFSNITADLIVTATYSVSTYQINYVLNGGENHIANPSSYTIGASAVVLKDPSKVGYNFLGWYDNINFAGEVVQTISSNMGSINLYAKWKKIVFDITFRKNGHITVVTVGYGDKITKPNNPEKTNCAFEGWYADIALTEKFDFDKVYNANKTIYAKWTCNLDVKLVIDDNPGEIKENTIVGREVDTLSSLIEKYKDAKTGYTLINLSYKNLDTAEINEITETTVFDYDSRFEIIANYEANQYKVFLYPDNGATDPPPITVSYDEEILFLASPKREGYKFLGWYDNASDMFVQNGDIYASPNNTSLIAKWEKETSDFPWLYAGVGFGLGAVLTAIILLAAFYILVKKNNAQAKAITSKIENLEKQVENDKE